MTLQLLRPEVSFPAWLDRDAYPFAGRYVSVPAGSMHSIDEGSGDPILFVHGTPSWSFEFRHLIQALAPTHRCVAPDLLGFGLSERPEEFAYTPAAHADALADFVDRLGLRNLTLVVHDFGGPIGLPLALVNRSVVKRVVVINSWLWPLDDDPVVRRGGRIAGSWLGKLLYREMGLPLRVLLPRAYGDRDKLTPPIHQQYLSPFASRRSREKVLWPLARELLGSSDYYASLFERAGALRSMPVTVIWGMRDPALGVRHLERWQQLVPEARITAVDRAGHWPHEEEPGAVIDAIRETLGR